MESDDGNYEDGLRRPSSRGENRRTDNGIEGLISIPRSEDGQFICISGEDYCGVCERGIGGGRRETVEGVSKPGWGVSLALGRKVFIPSLHISSIYPCMRVSIIPFCSKIQDYISIYLLPKHFFRSFSLRIFCLRVDSLYSFCRGIIHRHHNTAPLPEKPYTYRDFLSVLQSTHPMSMPSTLPPPTDSKRLKSRVSVCG